MAWTSLVLITSASAEFAAAKVTATAATVLCNASRMTSLPVASFAMPRYCI
ncbi:MAG: hypothetical protein R3C69_17205 [Geminicoccaceae bacterium]